MLLRRMVLLLLMLALTVFSAQAEDSFSVVDDEDGVVYDNLLPDAQAPIGQLAYDRRSGKVLGL